MCTCYGLLSHNRVVTPNQGKIISPVSLLGDSKQHECLIVPGVPSDPLTTSSNSLSSSTVDMDSIAVPSSVLPARESSVEFRHGFCLDDPILKLSHKDGAEISVSGGDIFGIEKEGKQGILVRSTKATNVSYELYNLSGEVSVEFGDGYDIPDAIRVIGNLKPVVVATGDEKSLVYVNDGGSAAISQNCGDGELRLTLSNSKAVLAANGAICEVCVLKGRPPCSIFVTKNESAISLALEGRQSKDARRKSEALSSQEPRLEFRRDDVVLCSRTGTLACLGKLETVCGPDIKMYSSQSDFLSNRYCVLVSKLRAPFLVGEKAAVLLDDKSLASLAEGTEIGRMEFVVDSASSKGDGAQNLSFRIGKRGQAEVFDLAREDCSTISTKKTRQVGHVSLSAFDVEKFRATCKEKVGAIQKCFPREIEIDIDKGIYKIVGFPVGEGKLNVDANLKEKRIIAEGENLSGKTVEKIIAAFITYASDAAQTKDFLIKSYGKHSPVSRLTPEDESSLIDKSGVHPVVLRLLELKEEHKIGKPLRDMRLSKNLLGIAENKLDLDGVCVQKLDVSYGVNNSGQEEFLVTVKANNANLDPIFSELKKITQVPSTIIRIPAYVGDGIEYVQDKIHNGVLRTAYEVATKPVKIATDVYNSVISFVASPWSKTGIKATYTFCRIKADGVWIDPNEGKSPVKVTVANPTL